MKVAAALSALALAHSALAIAEYYQCGGYEGITGECDAGNVYAPPPTLQNVNSTRANQAWFALFKILTTSTSRGSNYYWWFITDNNHHNYYYDHHNLTDYLQDYHDHHVVDYFQNLDHYVQDLDDF
ncbi:hypothetical protein FRC00_014718 [Tulasnella sp. 408]|nr:hypothetical protein FRC00_014718 [Tulasnella sp. 408]